MNPYAEAGIDWRDYERMQTQHRSETAYQQHPSWLFDDDKLKDVLCALIWTWLHKGHCNCPALLKTNLVELKRAADVQWAYVSNTQWGHTKEYRQLRKAVEHCGGFAQLIAKILWLYRTGANSVAIAQETGLSPVAIRQRLWRARQLAIKLGIEKKVDGCPRIPPVIYYTPNKNGAKAFTPALSRTARAAHGGPVVQAQSLLAALHRD